MIRWLLWFAVGALGYAVAAIANGRGLLERGQAIGVVISFAMVGWLVITVVAVFLKLVLWLVRPRHVTPPS